MPNSITSPPPSCIYMDYELIDAELFNPVSHHSRESVIGLTTDVSNSQNTMAQQTNKRAHSPPPENSKKLKSTSTSEWRNNLLLLADAAVIVESHNTEFSPTSEIAFISTQGETSGIPIDEIDSFVHEATHLAYMINDGNVTYSQKFIKYEWGLFEKIHRKFKENKEKRYPLNDKQVWEKIKIDLFKKYKHGRGKLLMWNADPYQQGTDDAQNITLKTVDMVKKELKHYLRQDLNFFLKNIRR